jgi:hypothetical protein
MKINNNIIIIISIIIILPLSKLSMGKRIDGVLNLLFDILRFTLFTFDSTDFTGYRESYFCFVQFWFLITWSRVSKGGHDSSCIIGQPNGQLVKSKLTGVSEVYLSVMNIENQPDSSLFLRASGWRWC